METAIFPLPRHETSLKEGYEYCSTEILDINDNICHGIVIEAKDVHDVGRI